MPSETSTGCADQSVEELRRELAEAREQQAATAEILRVISSSPTDLQRVFAEIATSAARLCDAYDAVIRQVDDDVLRLVAHHGPIPAADTLPLTPGFPVARAVLDRRTIHVTDMQALGEEYREARDFTLRSGIRTVLAMPLMRVGEAVGVIIVRRTEVRPFTDRQIDLLKTFADQAVIAIENARLFEAEQARTRELTESLEYQTATSDVLGVISRSPSQLQAVVDTIVQTAKRLCSAERATMWRLRDGKFDRLANTITDPAFVKFLAENPIPTGRGSFAGRAVLERRAVHVPDVWADPALGQLRQIQRSGIRTMLAVPLLREGESIGVLSLSRTEVQPFTDRQIRLVTTFADQAVIAIENTRLFEEVQARTRELTESLEQQTATADVLKVISRSALDVQKVLDALVESAVRLCDAYDAAIYQVFGDGLLLVAHHGQMPTSGPVGKVTFPLVRGLISGRAIIDRRPIHVADMQAETEEYPESR